MAELYSYIVESGGWCRMGQPSVLTRWPVMEMESWTARTRLKCGQWSGALRRVYLFSTEIHVQGYLPPSKVALSFIQRVEFQTNKCLYGSSNDCGPNWRGAKRTTNKFSVFAHARAHATQSCRSSAVSISVVVLVGVPLLYFISCQVGKEQAVLYKLNQSS